MVKFVLAVAVAVMMLAADARAEGYGYIGVGKSIDLGILGYRSPAYAFDNQLVPYGALGVGILWDKELVKKRVNVAGSLKTTFGVTLEGGIARADYRGVTVGVGGVLGVYLVCGNTTYIGHDWCSSSGGSTPSSYGGRTYGTDEDTLISFGGSLFVGFRKTMLGVTYLPLTGVNARIGFTF